MVVHRQTYVVAVALALLAIGARGQNLIQNGGFETGDFTGWTAGSGWEVVDWDWVEGAFSASVHTDDPVIEELRQTVTTTPGQWYLASAWIKNDTDPGGSNRLEVYWNGALIGFWDDMPSFDWSYDWANVQGTGSDTLSFKAYNTKGRWYLDDVRVEPAAVPEFPTLMPLALFSLSGFGLLRRRLRS